MPKCVMAGCNGQTTKPHGICTKCAGNKARTKNKTPEITERWDFDIEKASKVSLKSFGHFNKKSDYVAAQLVEHAKGIFGKKKGTSFGEQGTVFDFAEDGHKTATLDYQGTREGGGQYWLDYQGQYGGGSSKRDTHFQIMIQVCERLPAASMIADAISDTNGTGQRVIFFLDGQVARPR